MTNLTKYEQETIILYNNEEKTATISTCDRSLIRKLDRRLADYSEIQRTKSGEDFAEYILPKKWIKISFPRQLTDEQRAEMSNRMRAIREAQDDTD